MNKEEFLREIEKSLDKISEKERAEILYDYEEHFMIGKENGKSEEEICLELGSPKEIANNYLLNRTEDSFEGNKKEEPKENCEQKLNSDRRNLYIGSGIIVAVIAFFLLGYSPAIRYNHTGKFINGNKVETGGIRIDETGIHGNGISIDSNGVKVPGVRVDSNGIKVPGVRVDSNGVKVPGVSVDNNGVKVPGVNIDDNGVNIDLPDVKVDIKN